LCTFIVSILKSIFHNWRTGLQLTFQFIKRKLNCEVDEVSS